MFTPPPPPTKKKFFFGITTVFDFSWDDLIPGEIKKKKWLTEFYFWRGGGRGGGVNKLYCGLCENDEFKRDKLEIVLLFKDQK